jgi:hypothetical protein
MRISIRGRVLLVGACHIGWRPRLGPAKPEAGRACDGFDRPGRDLCHRAVAGGAQPELLVQGRRRGRCGDLLEGLGHCRQPDRRSCLERFAGRGCEQDHLPGRAALHLDGLARHADAGNPRRLQIFGQGLFGGTHGFDGLYPAMPAEDQPAPTRWPSRPAAASTFTSPGTSACACWRPTTCGQLCPTAPPISRTICGSPSASLTTSASAEQQTTFACQSHPSRPVLHLSGRMLLSLRRNP